MSKPINRLLVTERATLLEAMRVINEGSRAVALVQDADGRVVGTLTDGDIRRALLAGRSVHDCCLTEVMSRNFRSVTPETGRNEVLDLMRALGIEHVPVLDANRRLVGLHLLTELIGARERDNWAVIMVGGRGTRLRPLTEEIPKPMIMVAGRPILERLVLHLVGFGVRRIFLAVNYLGHLIEEHFGDGSRFGCSIEYLRESEPLGTAGALTCLPEQPREPLLVVNGDLVTQFKVDRMIEFHAQGQYAVTFGVRPHHIEIPFGVVDIQGNRLIGVREKPTEHFLVNAGIYLLSPPALALIPRGTEFPMTRMVEECAQHGLSMGAHVIEDEWIDVGHHDELRRARGHL